MTSLLASDHRLRLTSVDDALDVLASGLPGCVFSLDDLADGFYDLQNGLLGEVFQKFVNYRYQAAFIVPADHQLGERVTELIRDHANHPFIRFFASIDDASVWLREVTP